ncbi:MAG TPA: hypothetical protein VF789_14375 [Thermoanaerobaculia bacterium]
MIWNQILGPLFDIEQAQALMGLDSQQDVRELARKGCILVLDGSNGQDLYPAFQFDPAGRPYPEMAQVIANFSEAVETPYTIASWFVSPQDLLDGEIPVVWLRSRKDPSRLLAAARRSAGELTL